MALYKKGIYKIENVIAKLESFIINYYTQIYQVNEKEAIKLFKNRNHQFNKINNRNVIVTNIEIYVKIHAICKGIKISKQTLISWSENDPNFKYYVNAIRDNYIEIHSLHWYLGDSLYRKQRK